MLSQYAHTAQILAEQLQLNCDDAAQHYFEPLIYDKKGQEEENTRYCRTWFLLQF